MIDSHTHLDICDPPDAELVERARAAGLERILTVGTGPASNRAALAAAAAFDEVFAAVGHHPNATAGVGDGDGDLDDLAELARDPLCVAIGETGLDYYRDRAPREDQLRAFRFQIELARAVGKPLVIHAREADDDVIATLAAHADGIEVILHCFSMPDRLAAAAERGWWTSFAGNVTYPRNVELAAAAAAAPAERLLVETDAPYLTPQSRRRERNEPAYVVETARFVAEQRGLAPDELDALVVANAARLFGW